MRSRCPPASRARGRPEEARPTRRRVRCGRSATRSGSSEFHISPALQLVLAQTGVGASGTSSRSRRISGLGVLGDAARACDRFGEVGDDAVAPASHLVAEETEPPGGACSRRVSRRRRRARRCSRRRLLDDERALGEENPKGRVIEVAGLPPLRRGRRPPGRRASFRRTEKAAGTEGEPVEVDRGRSRRQLPPRSARSKKPTTRCSYCGDAPGVAHVARLVDLPDRLRRGGRAVEGGVSSSPPRRARRRRAGASRGDPRDEVGERRRRRRAAEHGNRAGLNRHRGEENQPRPRRCSPVERTPAPSETTARSPGFDAAVSSIISPPTEKPMPPIRSRVTSGRSCSHATAASRSCRRPSRRRSDRPRPVVAARVEQEHAVAVAHEQPCLR